MGFGKAWDFSLPLLAQHLAQWSPEPWLGFLRMTIKETAQSAQGTDFEVTKTLPWSAQRVLLECGQAEEGITKNLIFNQMFDFSQTGFSLRYLLSCHIVGLNIFISKHVTCPWAFLGYISSQHDLNYVRLKSPRTWPRMQIHTVLITGSTSSHSTSEVAELLLLKRHSTSGLSVLLLQSPSWRGYNLGCVNLIELKLGTPTVSPYRELSYE